MNENVIYGIASGDYQPQPNFSAWQNERGGWRAYQSFICREEALSSNAFRNIFAPGTSPSELDEAIDSYWDGLGLERVNWRNKPGGLAEIEVYFAGFSASGTSGPTAINPTYELRGELRDRSILEHPDVVALNDENRNLLRQMYDTDNFRYDGTTFSKRWILDGEDQYYDLGASTNPPQPSAGDAATFAALILGGVRTYQSPVFVWTKRWQDDSGLTASDLNNLGRTDGTPDGSPPTPNGSRTWLLTNAYQRQEGNLYFCEQEWTLSERNGWDTDIYS